MSSSVRGIGSRPEHRDQAGNGNASPGLAGRYQEVRQVTEALAAPLSPEDCVIQPMPDASPTKWHLAHTTWFFETFLLARLVEGYTPFHPSFGYLFNSYYNAVGERNARHRRGLVTRPSLDEVYEYRGYVDRQMQALLDSDEHTPELAALVQLGLHHEQQHQELIVTDIKYTLSCNPLRPAYLPAAGLDERQPEPLHWKSFGEGLYWIGYEGGGFAFDNESPRHRVFLESFELGSRLVTNGEYLAFMEDGGYSRPELWLSDGWNTVNTQGWNAPLYWEQHDGRWWQQTLAGLRAPLPAEPVCHVSYFEADAYARWAGARLATEAEWEAAAADELIDGNFLEDRRFHPAPAPPAAEGALTQIFGDAWEWTGSSYLAYPGYRPVEGALGEYNGKFMCNQMVLRGGSCATPASHIRPTYRNFFPTDARWQFSGIRLARDV
jgi:ergothioneine biosynthesis protein EgtB